MTIGKGKRPRDPNQLAKWIVDQSTTPQQETELMARQPGPTSGEVSAYMASIGSKGGKIGGKRRLKTMSEDARKKVARKAARARWGKKKH
jgi:hypothetical protein